MSPSTYIYGPTCEQMCGSQYLPFSCAAVVLRAIVWGVGALLHSLVWGCQRLDKDRLRELLNAYISMRQDLRNLLTLKKQVCSPCSTVTILAAQSLSSQHSHAFSHTASPSPLTLSPLPLTAHYLLQPITFHSHCLLQPLPGAGRFTREGRSG